MTINYGRYDFYVLMYDGEEFEAVDVTTGYFSSLCIAKTYALSLFSGDESAVPVLCDSAGHFHYYHPKFGVWYKQLTDEQLKRYFPFLINAG